jgi:transcription elongation factor GreA
MAGDRIPMTRDGYEKLKADLDRMQNTEMIEVAKRIAAAREFGDLSENAEYHAAREDQGMLQARIDSLRDKLSRAVLVDPSTLPSDTVSFGSRVRVKDVDDDEEETYQLVGHGEEHDSSKGDVDLVVLIDSPLGKGLIGKKLGEVAEIQVPRGVVRLKILEITPPA